MAGETPGASNARSNKRKLRWQDDKSTNKIYASGDISALGTARTVADSTLKPGQEPAAVPTPKLRTDDKSADKYYANGGSARVRGPQAAAAEKAARRGMTPPANAPTLGVAPRQLTATANTVVASKEDVAPALDRVVARLLGGETGLVVYVKQGDAALLKRVRAALDLLVTREKITEDQYREVRLSYELAPGEQAGVAEKLGVPQATATVRTEDNEAAGVDPLAFLNGEGDDPDDPVVDTSPVEPVAVDTTADPEPAGADEDDDDFLTPSTPAAEKPMAYGDDTADLAESHGKEPEAAPPEPAGEEKPADEQPRRRSKRYGRGSD